MASRIELSKTDGFWDLDSTNNASVFDRVVIGVAVCAGLHFIASAFAAPPQTSDFGMLLALYAVLYGLSQLSRSGRFLMANLLFVIGIFTFLAISAFYDGGIRSHYFMSIILVGIFAGLQINFQTGLVFTGIYIVTGVVFGVVELNGDLPSVIQSRSSSSFTFAALIDFLGGLLLLYFVVLRDVGTRLRTNNTQQTTSDLREALIHCISDGVFAFDRQVRITEWNPGMEAISGFRREDVLGKCGYDVIPFLKKNGKDKSIFEILAGRDVASTVICCVNPETGQKSYSEAQYSPLRTTSGEVVGGLASVRKITTRERVAELLLESEEKFRNIAHTAKDAIIVLDEQGKIIFWNKAAEGIFKYSEEEILGLPFAVLLPGEYSTAHEQHVARFQEQDRSFHERGRSGIALRNGGEEFPVEWWLTSWKVAEDKFTGVIVRDVTKDHENRQRLVDHERLATVGSIAAGIVHDFNNALMTIILSCELLLDEMKGSPSSIEPLTIVLRQAQQAATLAEQILDYSRQREMKKQPLHLNKCLGDLIRLLKRTFPENIDIRLKCAAEDCIANGDSNLLQQALLNLAINARDAMPNGGKLHFRVSLLAFDPGDPPPFVGMPPGEWIRLDVTDTGEGILSENLPRVFEPFFTTKKDGEGYGLGLAQVYGIVKQHDGFIDVVSRLNKGTTFTIYLPALGRCKENEMVVERKKQMRAGGETILVVEDDEATRRALSEVLGVMNFRAIAANSSMEAIEIYEKGEVDLVLCDMVMPEMGGLKLYETLAKKDPQVKMIIITGYPIENRGAGLLKAGISAVINKPTDGTTIFETIVRVLDGEVQGLDSLTDYSENNAVMRVT